MATRDINVRIGVDQASLSAGLAQAQASIQRASGGMATGFQGVSRAADQASAAIRRSAASTNVAAQAVSLLRSRFGALISVYAAWRAAASTVQQADQMALINSRMSGLIGTTEGAAQASEQLFRIAQRLQVPYEGLGDAFARMYPAIQTLNGGIEETVQLSEILAITARLSGAGTAEATAAQIQFAQALSSGVLQGDELRSILENNNTLARALADGLGVQVGRLREMGKEGQLTADVVANALLGQYDKLKARSDEIALTVGGAWDTVGNAYARLVDRMSNSTGVLGGLVALFRGLAQALEAVGRMFTRAEKESAALARVKIKEWANLAAQGFGILADGLTLMTTNVRALISVWTTMFKVVQQIKDLEFGKAWDEAVAGAGRVADIVRGNIAILQGEAGVYREILRMQAQVSSGTGGGGGLSGGGANEDGKPLAWKDDPDRQLGRDIARQIGEEREALRRAAEEHRQIQQIRLEATRARLADEIDAEEQAAERMRENGEITANQLLELQAGYEQRRYALARAALQERLSILATDPDASPVERARILAEIEKLEIEHGARLRQIRLQVAEETSAFGAQFWPAIENGITQMANGIAQGTIRIQNFWRTMWQGLVQITFSALAQIGARWLVTQLMALAGAKSTALSQVSSNAAVAGSAAVASTAAIPIVGPMMAPAAGAAAFAAALGFASAIPAAARGFDVPAGINPVTQLHQREMVLPQKYADVVRAMAEGGAGAGSMSINFNVAAMDARSFGEFLEANTDQLARGIKKAARKAGILPGGRG